MLIRICKWCPVHHRLPAKPGDELHVPSEVSHGMCWAAFGRELAKLESDPAYGLEPEEDLPCVDATRGQLSLV